jgi:uncharacterized linocin/CFP29 family protein
MTFKRFVSGLRSEVQAEAKPALQGYLKGGVTGAVSAVGSSELERHVKSKSVKEAISKVAHTLVPTLSPF